MRAKRSLQAVGQDEELEADVFEELDEEHQLEFLEKRPDAEIASVLANMESDHAADLILELDQERRIPVLDLLPAGQAAQDSHAARLQPFHGGRPDGHRLPDGR